MTYDEFDSLVRRLEEYAKRHPRMYRFRVVLTAVLGYAYVFAVAGVLLALTVLLVLLAMTRHNVVVLYKLGIPLLVLIYIIGRALVVRAGAVEGTRVARDEAPGLFDAIDEVRALVGAPPVHEVVLTDEFNASVVQLPRNGIFFLSMNYLVLGVPLMQALSTEQFKAVLAHEFGHLYGGHSKLSGWIYRIRAGWYRLIDALKERQHWGIVLFWRFYNWYVPFFDAYTFVLRREREYEADAISASVAGPRVAADALTTLNLRGDLLAEGFWPRLYRRADREPEPPGAYTALTAELRSTELPNHAPELLQRALAQKTGTEDTHPSLADRLAALGEESRMPDLPGTSAADALLGRLLDELVSRFDDQWKDHYAEEWRERYEYVQQAMERLAAYKAEEPTELQQRWDHAQLLEEFEGPGAALPYYRRVLEDEPELAPAHYAVGRLLLGTGEEEGVRHIDEAIRLDEAYAVDGNMEIYHYLISKGREPEAEPYYEKAAERHHELEMAEQERAGFSRKDRLAAHGLPDEALEHLQRQLARFPFVLKAYLVRKVVEHQPERPFYIVGVQLNAPTYVNFFESTLGYRGLDEDTDELAQELELPGQGLIVPLNLNSELRKRIKKIKGSLIYQKGRK